MFTWLNWENAEAEVLRSSVSRTHCEVSSDYPRTAHGKSGTALTDMLENSGVLSSLRANLRTEIVKALEEPGGSRPPKPPQQNCLINELILEYLAFNNYNRTASILEAGTSRKRRLDQLWDVP